MRRKTYEVLFEPEESLTALAKHPSLWRSASYFTMSVGFFAGVVLNTWLYMEPLHFRMALILAAVVNGGAALTLYAFLLHGILETFGAMAGDSRTLVCLLGYSSLPYLVLTPAALLCSRLGFEGLPFLALVFLSGAIWQLYLLVRTLEIVYILDFVRATATILFSLLMLYIVYVFPWQVGLTIVFNKLGF